MKWNWRLQHGRKHELTSLQSSQCSFLWTGSLLKSPIVFECHCYQTTSDFLSVVSWLPVVPSGIWCVRGTGWFRSRRCASFWGRWQAVWVWATRLTGEKASLVFVVCSVVPVFIGLCVFRLGRQKSRLLCLSFVPSFRCLLVCVCSDWADRSLCWCLWCWRWCLGCWWVCRPHRLSSSPCASVWPRRAPESSSRCTSHVSQPHTNTGDEHQSLFVVTLQDMISLSTGFVYSTNISTFLNQDTLVSLYFDGHFNTLCWL